MDKIRPIAVSRRCIKELDIALDSPEWFDWLATQKTFSYRGDSTDMNCVRRSNGRWYANKKIHSDDIGKLKTVSLYVGDDKACTEQKLADINEKFGLGYPGFWKWYYSSARKGDADKGSTQEDKCTPDIELSSQLQEEIANLKALVEARGRERDQLANLMAGRDERHSYEMQSVLQRIEQLRSENQMFKKQLSECSLQELNKYLGEIGGIPLDDKGKPKARYDQLAKFRTWLESLQSP